MAYRFMVTMRNLLRMALERQDDLRQMWFQWRLRRRGNVLETGCHIARGAEVATRIKVGRGTRINGRATLKGAKPVQIGRWCDIGEGVTIVSSDHDMAHPILNLRLLGRLEILSNQPSGEISIGNNVWIGDNAILLKGVSVGNGAVIGAQAVVTRDVAPYSVVAGSPAREIRKRLTEDEIRRQEELAWWDWPEAKLLTHRDLLA